MRCSDFIEGYNEQLAISCQNSCFNSWLEVFWQELIKIRSETPNHLNNPIELEVVKDGVID